MINLGHGKYRKIEDINFGLELVRVVNAKVKIEDDFIHETSDELSGLYSASIRREMYEKLLSEAKP